MIEAITTDRGDTVVKAGAHTLACITAATDPAAVARFVSLCEKHSVELAQLGIDYEERREWNFAHPGQGKNWPAFNKRDKMVARLLREAGIKDS